MELNEIKSQNKDCFFCKSTKLKRFKARASDGADNSLVNIIECKECNFAWQYPLQRTLSESEEFFSEAYADEGETVSDYFNPTRKREIAELEFGFLQKICPNPGKLLDVGAGAGIFAELAAGKGWRVTAVDPALDEKMIKNTLVKPIKGTIENLSEEDMYDVITMWDVIEHAMNPIDLILCAKKHLNKGGWLIVETGNYKSTGRIVEMKRHWIYQLDHKWYFSPEGLQKLLAKQGFSDIVFSEKMLRPGAEESGPYIGPSRLLLLKSIMKNPFNIYKDISIYFSLLKAKNWKMASIEIFAMAAKK